MTLKQTSVGLVLSALLCICSLNELKSAESKPFSDFTVDKKDKTHWFDIKNLGVEGKGWTDTEAFFNRLPAKAKGVVPQASPFALSPTPPLLKRNGN